MVLLRPFVALPGKFFELSLVRFPNPPSSSSLSSSQAAAKVFSFDSLTSFPGFLLDPSPPLLLFFLGFADEASVFLPSRIVLASESDWA